MKPLDARARRQKLKHEGQRVAAADCGPFTLHILQKAIQILLADQVTGAHVDLPDALHGIIAEGRVFEVHAIMREVGADDQQRLGIHEAREGGCGAFQRGAVQLADNQRHELEIFKRNLQQRVEDLRAVLGGMYRVVAGQRHGLREGFDGLAVDCHLPQRRTDTSGSGRHHLVTQPDAVAWSQQHNAGEGGVLNQLDAMGGGWQRVGIAGMRQHEHIGRCLLRRTGHARQRPQDGITQRRRTSRIPGTGNRALKNAPRLCRLYTALLHVGII